MLTNASLPSVASAVVVDDSETRIRLASFEPTVPEVPVLMRQSTVRTTEGDYPEWEASRYTVQAGDTVSGIAARYGIGLRTLIWANDSLVRSPDSLSLGDELVILPVDGAYYTVKEGDTIQGIAEKYEVEPSAILAWGGNDIPDPEHLAIGLQLIVPGAKLPEMPERIISSPTSTYASNQTQTAIVSNPQAGTGSMMWPVGGYVSQGVRAYHVAIDIAGKTGSPVVAADDGTVVLVSWITYGYGYHVIIDHSGGLETLYAHLSSISVEVGQNVSKGETIGARGSTGRSTGPHLHFEVRQNGARMNPFAYLP